MLRWFQEINRKMILDINYDLVMVRKETSRTTLEYHQKSERSHRQKSCLFWK